MNSNVIIFVIAVVLSIVIGLKLKTNIGMIGMAFAFICGPCFFGIGPSKVLNYFPVSTLATVFCGTYFYGFAIENGSFKNIAKKIIWKFRDKPKLMPIVLCITGNLICFLGCNSGANAIFFSPIVFSILTEMGVNPILGFFIVYSGSNGGSMMPWTGDFANKMGYWIPQFGETARPFMTAFGIYACVFEFCAFLVAFFLFKGYNGKAPTNVEVPEPLNDKQKLTLKIIAVFSLLLLLPPVINMIHPNAVCKWMKSNISIYILSTVGAVVCHCCKLGDIDKILTTRVPWKSMMIVGGMGTLMGMANDIGVTDIVGRFITESVPRWAIPAAVVMCCSLLSTVVHGAVVQTMMNSLVPVIAGVSGWNIYGLGLAVQSGLTFAGISQFSAGGTVAVIGCTDDKVKASLVMPQFYTAMIFMVVNAILGSLGLFEAIGGLVGDGLAYVTL